MAKLVRSSKGGKTVQLAGTWGSGKSTVISLLKKELEFVGPPKPPDSSGGNDDQDFLVFQYDAWSHAGDPLRRAFVSALLDALESRSWVPKRDESPWSSDLEKLNKRVNTSYKTSKASMSPKVKMTLAGIVALLVLSPVLASWLTNVMRRLISAESAPVILVFALGLGLVMWGLLGKVDDNVLNAVLKRTPDGELTTTSGELDPTTLDFQKVFKAFVSHALGSPTRHLILVFDNIDRVEDDQAKEVWALFRLLLDNPEFRGKPWFERLWIIVPTAESFGVSGITDVSTHSSGTSDKERTPNPLEKIFQLRFRINEPMLQSWKTYLFQKLVQAFPGESSSQFEDILRLYGIKELGTSVHPRSIITFVNDLVTMRMEWPESEVLLSQLGAYVLVTATGQDPMLADFSAIDAVVAEDNTRSVFAMLKIRANSIEEAAYLTEYPKLEGFMENGDGIALRAFVTNSESGYYLFDQYVHRDLPKLVGQQRRLFGVTRAIAPLFDSLGEYSILKPRLVGEIRRSVSELMRTTSGLEVEKNGLVDNIKALSSVLGSISECLDILRPRVDFSGSYVSENGIFNSGKLSQLLDVGDLLAGNDLAGKVSPLGLRLIPNEAFGLLRLAEEGGRYKALAHLFAADELENLARELTAAIPKSELYESLICSSKVLRTLGVQDSTPQLVSELLRMSEVVVVPNGSGSYTRQRGAGVLEIAGAFERAWQYEPFAAKDCAVLLSESGELARIAQEVFPRNVPDSTAAIVYTGLAAITASEGAVFTNSVSVPNGFWSDSVTEEVAKILVDKVVRFRSFDVLQAIPRFPVISPLVSRMASLLSSQPAFDDWVTLSEGVPGENGVVEKVLSVFWQPGGYKNARLAAKTNELEMSDGGTA